LTYVKCGDVLLKAIDSQPIYFLTRPRTVHPAAVKKSPLLSTRQAAKQASLKSSGERGARSGNGKNSLADRSNGFRASRDWITPFKRYSGRFNVRISPDLHGDIVTAAEASGSSLNQWVEKALSHVRMIEAHIDYSTNLNVIPRDIP
jgi:hypothetical protein